MGFWGRYFQYDGKPSDQYGLTISQSVHNTAASGGEETDPTGSDLKLYLQEYLRRPTPTLLGIQQTPPLTFDIEANISQEMTATDYRVIASWLFGNTQYKKLQIVQDDMSDMYFNGIFVKPQIKRAGNLIRGFYSTFTCDSPWGWTFPQTITKNYTTSIVNDSFVINNLSDNNFYLRPLVVVTMNIFDGFITLTNVEDNNRQFSITTLASNEVVTINNDLQIITSSTGLNRLGNFNLNWFQLLQGINHIQLSGNVSQVKITYQFARKMAG